MFNGTSYFYKVPNHSNTQQLALSLSHFSSYKLIPAIHHIFYVPISTLPSEPADHSAATVL